jgi:hypothetical protein
MKAGTEKKQEISGNFSNQFIVDMARRIHHKIKITIKKHHRHLAVKFGMNVGIREEEMDFLFFFMSDRSEKKKKKRNTTVK